MVLQDSTPLHSTNAEQEHLSNCFGNRWIGGRGPVLWSARSPRLNPLDFYFWGHMRRFVYASPVFNCNRTATLHSQYGKILRETSGSVNNETEIISNIYRHSLYFLRTLVLGTIMVRVQAFYEH